MKKNKTKKNIIQETILKFLYVYGMVRVVDLIRYANYKYETCARGSQIYLQLKEDGYVTEIIYLLKTSAREGNKNIEDKICVITPKGEAYISKLYPHLNMQTEYSKQNQLLPKESDELNKKLTDRGIMLNFLSVGVPVFPDEKPSLDYLQKTLGNVSSNIKLPSGYMDHLSENECKLFLKNRIDKETNAFICGGAYYTIREFLKYSKRNETFSDTFIGTRIRGIYISWDTCYLVFTPKRFANRMISVKYKSEKGLLTALRKTLSFTNIYRPIKELSYGSFIKENSPAAIIFSDGNRLAYEMATGSVKGKSKDKSNMIKTVESIEQNAFLTTTQSILSSDGNNNWVATSFLTAGTELFDDMYVLPLSNSGLVSLEYLISNSKENMIKDSQQVIESVPDFYKTKKEIGLYPYHNKKYPENNLTPEYVPVLNVKQLRWIREKGGEPFIITDGELLDPIAHSIKTPAHYYNQVTGEEYDKDSVFIYNADGKIAGLEILQEELKRRGLTISEPHEWNNLPKRLGVGRIELYNQLARGDIDIETIIEKTKVKPFNKEQPQKTKKKHVSFLLDDELYKYIIQVTQEKGISISDYFRKIVKKDMQNKK